MSSIKEPKIVKVLPLLIKLADTEYRYPALACANSEFWRGELNLTYSNFHGWNWANAEEQLTRSKILPLASLPIQGLVSRMESLKGWTFEEITKEAYESYCNQAREQMETQSDL